jgi:hypothetical protein
MAGDGRWRMWRVSEPEAEHQRSRTRRHAGSRREVRGAPPVRPERDGIVFRRWWNV